MSVNGLSVRVPGRTSSQVSVYDYPEHLNPFYEDENHKRLRFWKLSSGSKKSGRRNSTFSLDGLKEMWSFKSFKLKKKSSTLGINKTSESPPMLRRDEDTPYSNNNAYRHTYNVGLGSNFDRGAAYRNSLQNINSNRPADNCFLRHSRYRYTVQNNSTNSPGSTSSNQYNCGGAGSVTPTLRTKYIRPGLSRGSSQYSVNSTNPFEDDYMDTVSQAGSVDGVVVRRSGRKKRRAPQPPTTPVAYQVTTAAEEGATENKGNNNKLTDETVNITNLTAEIETFVKTADLDNSTKHEDDMAVLKIVENGGTKVDTISIEENAQNSRQSPENNECYPDRESESPERKSNSTNESNASNEKIGNLGTTVNLSNGNCDRNKRSPVKILIREPTVEDKNEEEPEFIEQNRVEEDAPKYSHKFKGKKIVFKYEDKPEAEEENGMTNGSSDKEENGTQGNTTPKSTEVEFILEHEQMETLDDSISQINELKITESTDDLTAAPSAEATTTTFEAQYAPLRSSSPVLSRKIVDLKDEESSQLESNKGKTEPVTSSPPKNTKFEVRSVPLKNFSPVPERRQSDSSVPAEDDVVLRNKDDKPPTPPQRRRSVKEIIESINKSQSLLKVNQKDSSGSNQYDDKYDYKYEYKYNDKFSKFPTEKNNNTINYLNGNLDKNLNDLSASDLEINKMILEMDRSISENEIKNIPNVVERFSELTKNNQSLFEKCVVRRENNETFDGVKKSNNSVDWNPVPKPRRHKHSTQKP